MKPPRRHERQVYRDRIEWRWYNRFLPEGWRLCGPRVPREEWWSWNGVDVHLDRLDHPDPRAVVIVLHGGGGNGRVVMTLGAMLRELGAEVVAPDLPGYGLTRPRRARDTTYDRWADLSADLARAEAERTGLPVVLFGLSLGGLLAYGTAAREPEVAGVIATTLVDTRTLPGVTALARSRLLGVASYPLLPLLPPGPRAIRFPIRWVAPMHLITNDPDFSALFARDPLAGGASVTLGFLRSLRLFDVRREPESFASCPVLVAHPALDAWTPPHLSRAFFDRIAGEKEWVDLEGCGHLPYEEPGAQQLKGAVARFLGRVGR